MRIVVSESTPLPEVGDLTVAADGLVTLPAWDAMPELVGEVGYISRDEWLGEWWWAREEGEPMASGPSRTEALADLLAEWLAETVEVRADEWAGVDRAYGIAMDVAS